MSPTHLEHVVDGVALGVWRVSAVGLVALLVVVGGCTALGVGGRRRRALLVAAAAFGGGFQLAHFAEHVAQSGYWTTHRSEPPWMTPWARSLVDAFQSVAGGTPGFGMEALHLVGNAIFLAGAVAVVAVLASVAASPDVRLARIGLLTQTVHVAEHVALTATVMVVGRPIGVSTLFGTVDAGPALWTYRIWWHLAINTAATALIGVAVARHAHARPAHPVAPTALTNRTA